MVTINIFESGATGGGVQGGGKEPLQDDGRQARRGGQARQGGQAGQAGDDNPPSPEGQSFSFDESKSGPAPSPSESGSESFASADAPAPVMQASENNQDNFTPIPSDSMQALFAGNFGAGITDSDMPKPDDRILSAADEMLSDKKSSKK
jgi:hypothetical protein